MDTSLPFKPNTMNKIYIPVDVQDGGYPKEENTYYVGWYDDNRNPIILGAAMFSLETNSFEKDEEHDAPPHFWLKPIDKEEYDREIAGKAFEAGTTYEWDNHFGPIPNPNPNKEQYLNSL